MCRSNETKTTSKEETWSRGTNSRLPFDVNVVLNLSINSHVYASLRSMAVLPGARLSGEPSKARVNGKRSSEKNENFSSCSRANLLAVSLSSPAFIIQRAQPKPPSYAGYVYAKRQT